MGSGPQWPCKLGKVSEWVRCVGGFMVAIWVPFPLSTSSPAGLTQPSLCLLLSPSSPLPIVQGPAIFWLYFLMRLPWAFSRYFFNILPSPREVWGWCQAPGKSLLPWGPQASCHLLFAFHPPGCSSRGSASLLPSLLGTTCQGPPARCDHWVPSLFQTVDPGCAADPGFSKTRSAQSCGVNLAGHGSPWTETPAGPSLPCLCLFWNICSAAGLLLPRNCLPQVIFQGIYQRRKWWQSFLSLGLTCVLALISLSCTKSNSSCLCTSSVPLTVPFVKTALSRCNLHAIRFTSFKYAT